MYIMAAGCYERGTLTPSLRDYRPSMGRGHEGE